MLNVNVLLWHRSIARSPTVVLRLGLPRWYKSQSFQGFPSASELNLLYLPTPQLVFMMPLNSNAGGFVLTLGYNSDDWSIELYASSSLASPIKINGTSVRTRKNGLPAIIFTVREVQQYSIKVAHDEEKYTIE